MFKPLLLATALLAGPPPIASAQDRTPAPAPAAAAQTIYVAVYRRGLKFDPAKGVQNAGIREHIQHFQSLGERLIAAGTVQQTGDDLLGYVILRAPDQAAAEAWLKADPSLAAGSMSAEIRRWGVSEIKGWRKPAP
jgi:uncharacterized protein YciI